MAKEDIIKKDIITELKDMESENDQSHLEPVNVVIGRYQPFTIGHLGMAKELEKINGLPSVYIYIRSKSGKNSKFSDNLTINYMDDIAKGQDLVRDAWSMTGSFIPVVIMETQRRGYNPVLIGAGEDRAKTYTGMAKRMKNITTHPDFAIQELKGRLTSGTEVRQAIIDGDEKKFKKFTPKQIHPYYKQLKDELEDTAVLAESVDIESVVMDCNLDVDTISDILESYGEDLFSDALIVESILDYELNEKKSKRQTFSEYLKDLDDRFVDGINAIKGQNGSDDKLENRQSAMHSLGSIFRNYISSLQKEYGKDKNQLTFIKEQAEIYNIDMLSLEEAIKYKKGKTYQSGNGWTVYKNDDEVHFSIEVDQSSGWSTDPHYTDEMRFMDSGKRKGTYRIKSGNIEKQAKEMFDIGTKENDENYGLTYKDYADIIRLSINMQNAINMNESELNEKFNFKKAVKSIKKYLDKEDIQQATPQIYDYVEEYLRKRYWNYKKEIDEIVKSIKGIAVDYIQDVIYIEYEIPDDVYHNTNRKQRIKQSIPLPKNLQENMQNAINMKESELNEKSDLEKLVNAGFLDRIYPPTNTKNWGKYTEKDFNEQWRNQSTWSMSMAEQAYKARKNIKEKEEILLKIGLSFDAYRSEEDMKNAGKAFYERWMKHEKLQENVNEGRKPKLKFKKEYPTYAAGYGTTLDNVANYIEDNGYFYNQQEFFGAFGDAFFKPKKGKTQSKTITIFRDKQGKEPIGNLHISIYNRGVDGNTYELVMYHDQLMRESLDEELHNQSLTKSNVKIFEKILMFRKGTLELENDEKDFIPFLSKISESKLQKFKDFQYDSKLTESILDFDKFKDNVLESNFIKRHLKPFLIMEGLNDYAIEKLVEGFLKVNHVEYCNYFKGNVNEGIDNSEKPFYDM